MTQADTHVITATSQETERHHAGRPTGRLAHVAPHHTIARSGMSTPHRKTSCNDCTNASMTGVGQQVWSARAADDEHMDRRGMPGQGGHCPAPATQGGAPGPTGGREHPARPCPRGPRGARIQAPGTNPKPLGQPRGAPPWGRRDKAAGPGGGASLSAQLQGAPASLVGQPEAKAVAAVLRPLLARIHHRQLRGRPLTHSWTAFSGAPAAPGPLEPPGVST